MQGHEEWLKIATEDLKAAYGLISLELFSAVVYHCQQSAEKSLKAFLVFKKYPIVKSHDLMMLLELCMKFDNDFKNKLIAADYINPFSSKFRYPTEFEIPDLADAQRAAKYAEDILDFVIKKINGFDFA